MSPSLALEIIELLNDSDERSFIVATYAADPSLALEIIGSAGAAVVNLDMLRTMTPMAVFSYLLWLDGDEDSALAAAQMVLGAVPGHRIALGTRVAIHQRQKPAAHIDYLVSQLPILQAAVRASRGI